MFFLKEPSHSLFSFFLFGSLKVVTVEKVESNASKGIVSFVQDIQFRSKYSTLNTLDLSAVVLELRGGLDIPFSCKMTLTHSKIQIIQ